MPAGCEVLPGGLPTGPDRQYERGKEGKSFYEITEASYPFGWRTFDHACLESYEDGKITEDVALLYATKRDIVNRGIDKIRKSRGEVTTSLGELRMQHVQTPKKAPATDQGGEKKAGRNVLKLK